MATLNPSNINKLLDGINAVHRDTFALAYAERKLSDLMDTMRDAYGIGKGEKMPDDVKKAINDDADVKKARKDVRECKERAYGRANVVLVKYTDIDFTDDKGDALLSTSTFESILRNADMLSGDLKACKDKQVIKAIACFKQVNALVLNRRRDAMARRKKGDDVLTYTDAKEYKNDALEYLLAFSDALVYAFGDVFEYTRDDKGRRVLVNKYAG